MRCVLVDIRHQLAPRHGNWMRDSLWLTKTEAGNSNFERRAKSSLCINTLFFLQAAKSSQLSTTKQKADVSKTICKWNRSVTTGLANFNPNDGHIIRKDSSEYRTFWFIFRRGEEFELTITSLFTKTAFLLLFITLAIPCSLYLLYHVC